MCIRDRYAIAREYGLPSVGGISLYLVDDGNGNGGPRIGDSTWAALWSSFFEDDLEDALPPPPLSDVFESEPHQRVSSFSYQRRGSGQYPTLGGQLYAIAREYGLPSVGGISLYLVDDGNGDGGPRIGDSTWAALWLSLIHI